LRLNGQSKYLYTKEGDVLNKIKTLQEVSEKFQNGQSLMVGGFLCVGTPEVLIDALIQKGVKDLTLIANDSGFPEKGVGRLIVNKQIRKIIASHVGTNKETGRQINAGEIEYDLVPQGTLIERIRSTGAGLGGVLTPTGIGTLVEEGKQKITVDGKQYLLETALRADIALVHAWKADKFGNLVFRRASRNFNPIIAMAADLVIVAAEEIVEIGEIDPDMVMTPGSLVHMIVKA